MASTIKIPNIIPTQFTQCVCVCVCDLAYAQNAPLHYYCTSLISSLVYATYKAKFYKLFWLPTVYLLATKVPRVLLITIKSYQISKSKNKVKFCVHRLHWKNVKFPCPGNVATV